MSRHDKFAGRDVHKRGMTIEVKQGGGPEAQARNMENAIKNLKRRMLQEGVIRDLRAHEYFESKGTKKRKALQEAVRRANKAKRLAIEAGR
jgi:ribosomal protein S21